MYWVATRLRSVAQHLLRIPQPTGKVDLPRKKQSMSVKPPVSEARRTSTLRKPVSGEGVAACSLPCWVRQGKTYNCKNVLVLFRAEGLSI